MPGVRTDLLALYLHERNVAQRRCAELGLKLRVTEQELYSLQTKLRRFAECLELWLGVESLLEEFLTMPGGPANVMAKHMAVERFHDQLVEAKLATDGVLNDDT